MLHLCIRVFRAEARRIDESWNSSDVFSSYWRLYVNESEGASLVLEDGEPWDLEPGPAHLIPAWVRFSCRATRSLTHHFAHFEVVGLPTTLCRQCFSHPCRVKTVGLGVFRAIPAAEWSEGSIGLAEALAIQGLCATLLSEVVTGLPPDLQDRLARYGESRLQVEPALQEIEANLKGDLHIARLASACGYSADHFIRVFRGILGQTPGAYVMERRIAAAARALAFTSQAIDDIAESVGFKNRYYFSRVFAYVMGKPPAAYRKLRHV